MDKSVKLPELRKLLVGRFLYLKTAWKQNVRVPKHEFLSSNDNDIFVVNVQDKRVTIIHAFNSNKL
jgi:hypothetical protein